MKKVLRFIVAMESHQEDVEEADVSRKKAKADT
jgi:hypothetical protein